MSSRLAPMHSLVLGLALTVATAGAAHAAPVLVLDGGKVAGVNGLDVGGTEYDVVFSDNDLSFNQALAAVGPGIEWGSLASADAAAGALISFLNGEPVTAADMAWGSMDDSRDHDILVWHTLTATDVFFRYVDWQQPTEWVSAVDSNRGRDQSGTQVNNDNYTWPFFSPSPSTVPAPATAALLLPGLLGAVASRRRRRAASRTHA